MDLFEQVKQKVDLAEYVAKRVELKRSGRQLVGLCPFHSENTPSFFVEPSKRVWKCWGCDRGGTIIDYVVYERGCTVWEAVEYLAEMAGIPVGNQEDYQKRKAEYQRREQIAILVAQKVDKVRDYLHSRGLTDETIKEFGLGFGEKNNSIVIPIHDKYGRVVAFAERFLDGQTKYRNSPNDELYNKSETLYNLHRARRHIKDRLYVVEGYFDAMALWQMGAKAVVAVCRDSLTQEQARLIRECVTKDVTIVLVIDNDEAGWRSVERNRATLRSVCPQNHVTVMIPPPSCKDANDALQQGISLHTFGQDSADMWLLKRAIEDEPDQQKQYLIAKRIADQAPNEMVRHDMAEYLAKKWSKDLATVMQFLGAKGDSQAQLLAKIYRVDDVIPEYRQYLQKRNELCVTTGYPSLNKHMDGGVKPGEVLQCIARSAVGKTTLLLNIVSRIITMQRVPVILFSLEMQKEKIFEVLLQIQWGLPREMVREAFLDKDFEPAIQKDLEFLRKYLLIVDEGGLTLQDIEEMIHLADMHLTEQPIRAVFIDYLGYIKMNRRDSYERTSELARELKELAKRTNKAVFSLHQTSRAGGDGSEPVDFTMARDSGAVEESADYLLGAWRPELNPDLKEEELEKVKGQYYIRILKSRDGPKNVDVLMHYDPITRRITEWTDWEAGKVVPLQPRSRTAT